MTLHPTGFFASSIYVQLILPSRKKEKEKRQAFSAVHSQGKGAKPRSSPRTAPALAELVPGAAAFCEHLSAHQREASVSLLSGTLHFKGEILLTILKLQEDLTEGIN